ncbi:hypothetical protein [uncultured Acetobacteroides sp.]|uniref:hypothetical protein n=1 Tax=uncultured Acetobacteroides sp. TaxID=1760811 RepID=UPI0029F52846|nr:hypothetical protein [uncultured Acetobacteroides sp.]
MNATNAVARFISIALLCATGASAAAQNADTLKADEAKQALPKVKPMLPVRFTPSLYMVPYYYTPKPLALSLPGSHLTTTNMLLLKSSSTDNALSSINLTLSKDRERDKTALFFGIAATAAVWGGVVNQAINGKRLSKEAQQKRAEAARTPVRR